MTSDYLTWLQNWYVAQCNGDWEHQYGIKIETLDNPGWALEIDLIGTTLEDAAIEPFEIHRTDQDWLVYKIETNKFRAFCGPLNLMESIDAFRIKVVKA